MDLWVPVVAALGASAITALATFGIAVWDRRARRRDDLLAARRSSYSRLLSLSGLLGITAQTMHYTMEFRSGVGENVDVLMGAKKALTMQDVDARIREDIVPLFDAWSDIWTLGTPEAVALANEVVQAASDVMAAATQEGEKHGRIVKRVVGERWTEDQIAEWIAAEQQLARARARFAGRIRDELGIPVAEFFLEPTSDEADSQ